MLITIWQSKLAVAVLVPVDLEIAVTGRKQRMGALSYLRERKRARPTKRLTALLLLVAWESFSEF